MVSPDPDSDQSVGVQRVSSGPAPRGLTGFQLPSAPWKKTDQEKLPVTNQIKELTDLSWSPHTKRVSTTGHSTVCAPTEGKRGGTCQEEKVVAPVILSPRGASSAARPRPPEGLCGSQIPQDWCWRERHMAFRWGGTRFFPIPGKGSSAEQHSSVCL